MTILIADDEPAIVDLVRFTLEDDARPRSSTPPTGPPRWSWRGASAPTWSCSTCRCRASTGSRPAVSSARTARVRAHAHRHAHRGGAGGRSPPRARGGRRSLPDQAVLAARRCSRWCARSCRRPRYGRPGRRSPRRCPTRAISRRSTRPRGRGSASSSRRRTRLRAAYRQSLQYADRPPQDVPAPGAVELLRACSALANALEAKDVYTRGHSERVAALARRHRARGRAVVARGRRHHRRRPGCLHDLGKIGVPEGVLRKPGPLSDEEWAVMRRHPVIGAQIVAPLEFFGDGDASSSGTTTSGIDGSGYPDGLRGAADPAGRPHRGGGRRLRRAHLGSPVSAAAAPGPTWCAASKRRRARRSMPSWPRLCRPPDRRCDLLSAPFEPGALAPAARAGPGATVAVAARGRAGSRPRASRWSGPGGLRSRLGHAAGERGRPRRLRSRWAGCSRPTRRAGWAGPPSSGSASTLLAASIGRTPRTRWARSHSSSCPDCCWSKQGGGRACGRIGLSGRARPVQRGWWAWRSGRSSARTCSSPRRGPSAIGCSVGERRRVSLGARVRRRRQRAQRGVAVPGRAVLLLWWRWAFWPAALVSTALHPVRYLLDPALPARAGGAGGRHRLPGRCSGSTPACCAPGAAASCPAISPRSRSSPPTGCSSS